MHFSAFSKPLLIAAALSASAVLSAPVQRDLGTVIEASAFAPLGGGVIIARGRGKITPKTGGKGPKAGTAPAAPAPGSMTFTPPAAGANQVKDPKGVAKLLNPPNQAQQNRLDAALTDSMHRHGTMYSIDSEGNPAKGGQQKTGWRLDGQGGTPEGIQANIQIQQNTKDRYKTTCATCIVHADSPATGADVADALRQSSLNGQIAHLWRRLHEMLR